MQENSTQTTTSENENVVSDYLQGYQQLHLGELEGKIRTARNTIFVVAALIVLGDIIIMATNGQGFADLWLTFGVAGLFVGLGLLCNKAPYAAIISALILYIALWILSVVVVSPEYLYKGILVKGIVIYYLIKTLKPAKEAEALRRQMKLPS